MTLKVDLMAAMRDIAEAADRLDQVYDAMFAGGKEIDAMVTLDQAGILLTRAVDLITKIQTELEHDDSAGSDDD